MIDGPGTAWRREDWIGQESSGARMSPIGARTGPLTWQSSLVFHVLCALSSLSLFLRRDSVSTLCE
jgi:hypothetical protein